MTVSQRVIQPLTGAERELFARCEHAIQSGLSHLDGTLKALITIHDRQLYREGYPDFDSYCLEKWGKTWRRFRQLIAATTAAKQLTEGATTIAPVNEAQLRPIASLPPSARAEVWEMAVQDAGGGQPTAKQVEDAKVKREVYALNYSPLIQRMNLRELTPQAARAAGEAIASCEPRVRSDLLRVGVSDPTVIKELNRLGREGRDSYAEIVASGHLQFADGGAVPAARAKAADLRRFLDEQAQEHKRRLLAEGGGITLPIWPDDPEKTLRSLKTFMSQEQLAALAAALQTQLLGEPS